MTRHYCSCFFTILSLLVTPLSASYFGRTEKYFAHFAAGRDSSTIFALHNPADSEIKVQVELFSSAGQLALSEGKKLDAGATETVAVGSSFSKLISGWVRLHSTAPFTATEFFQLQVGSATLPRVGVLPCTAVSEVRLFCFLRGESTNTGIAVGNPGDQPAELEFNLYLVDGSLAGTKTITLGAGKHLARFITEQEFFPGLRDFQGALQIESSGPVFRPRRWSLNWLLRTVPSQTGSGIPQFRRLICRVCRWRC